MTDLSPAAQAIRTAYSEGCYLLMPGRKHQLDGMACPGLTAALRALADQVVPQPPMIVEGGRNYEQAWTATVHESIRAEILAIAAELAGSNG